MSVLATSGVVEKEDGFYAQLNYPPGTQVAAEGPFEHDYDAHEAARVMMSVFLAKLKELQSDENSA